MKIVSCHVQFIMFILGRVYKMPAPRDSPLKLNFLPEQFVNVLCMKVRSGKEWLVIKTGLRLDKLLSANSTCFDC